MLMVICGVRTILKYKYTFLTKIKTIASQTLVETTAFVRIWFLASNATALTDGRVKLALQVIISSFLIT